MAAEARFTIEQCSAIPPRGLCDCRVYLIGIEDRKAATVNAYLASIRAIVRAQGRALKVKGVKQVQGPVETLGGCDLGRLINVMARASLRVGEAPTLKVGDIKLAPRLGTLLVREGKGLKERPCRR